MVKRPASSIAAQRKQGIYLPGGGQWGTTPLRGPTCTEEEKENLKKTGFYSVQWKKLRGKR